MPRKVTLDPHHEKILDALDGHLDHVVFEECAVELARQDGLPVVPVIGGQDDGFDGAVADGNGEPFPLLSTIGEDLLGNFKVNVEQARRKGWKADRVIFATSRVITPQKRRNLYKSARESNVTIIQAYPREWFAYRLYHNPHWCKRLLGLTGRPRALSVFPKTERPSLGDQVFGRDTEIEWLKSCQDDCLLVGGPGSGKTFLVQSLANEGHALFLVDEDREQIANDIRELQPPAVIIDDAHVSLDLIRSFFQLRKEIGAEHVRIIATCWTSEVDVVQSAMQLADQNVGHLDLIDADTMVEIIKSFGFEGPDQLIAIIREQAAGRPGLASTLVDLCMKDNVQRLISGEALVDQLSSQLSQTLDIDVKRLLAPFALGGDAGVRQSEVASFLGLPKFEISGKLSRLAAAGVIRERGYHALTVEPAPMRWILVRDIFFGGPGSLEWAPLLDFVENPISATKTLIRAVAHGAPFYDLLPLVERFNQPQLWAEYAKLGPTECEYVITQHPELIRREEVAEAGLHYVPEIAIPQLLNHEGEAMGPRQKDPLEYLRTWINDAYRDGKDGISQRTTLVQTAHRWWRQTRKANTAIRAMCISLIPSFEYLTPDPGRGLTIIGTQGTLLSPMLNEVIQLWPLAREVVADSGVFPCTEMLSTLFMWLYNGRDKPELPEETLLLRQEFAKGMLTDLAEGTRCHPGLQFRLREHVEAFDLEIDLVVDPVFEALFPGRILGDEEEELLIDFVVEGLGVGVRPSEEIVEKLAKIHEEALLADIDPQRSRIAERVCRKLADTTEFPVVTTESIIHHELPDTWLSPFLFKAANERHQCWSSVMDQCLKNPKYQEIGVSIILTLPEPTSAFLEILLSHAASFLTRIHESCSLGRVPGATLQVLLKSDNPEIACTAAVGHWRAVQKGITGLVDEEVWRQAILLSVEVDTAPFNYTGYEYGLREILVGDRDLAEEWLALGLEKRCRWFRLNCDGFVVQSVINAMDDSRRRKVLKGLPRVWEQATHTIVRELIGRDLDLYQELLYSRDQVEYHLSPLMGKPDWAWWTMAALALDAGHSVGKVVDATLKGGIREWTGNESDMWAEWRIAFKSLQDLDSDPRIQEISRRGVEVIRAEEERAAKQDHRRAVYGI